MRTLKRLITATFAVPLAIAAFTGCHHGSSSSNTVAPSAGDVTEFDSAVKDGDTDIVSRLISAKPEMVNAKDADGKTPTAIATEKGDTDMVNLLKKHGGHE
jgi:ankyrin repeat protein